MLIVGGEAFACMRVKTAGSMPYFRVLFGRQEAFPFYSVQVQYLGTFHVLDVTQHPGQVLYVMPVNRAEVTDVHPLKNVLLPRCYRLQAVGEADKCLPPLFIQDTHLEQQSGCLEP